MSSEMPEPLSKEHPASISRRDFLKKTALVAAGILVPAAALELTTMLKGVAPASAHPGNLCNPEPGHGTPGCHVEITTSTTVINGNTAGPGGTTQPHWQFLIDTNQCVGCGFCVKACKLENEVPYDANASRTWVERYVITKDGAFHADSPLGARDGFTTAEIDLGEGETLEIPPEDISRAFFVPKLCNQCNRPPCVQVCPVGATYKSPNGVVLVDRTWCIGCGYCVQACPYGARFFHPVYDTAEKCTFCEHRISKGLAPACVQACPFGVRQIGNQNDPNDAVAQVIATQPLQVLKGAYGTDPQCFYIGLDSEVR